MNIKIPVVALFLNFALDKSAVALSASSFTVGVTDASLADDVTRLRGVLRSKLQCGALCARHQRCATFSMCGQTQGELLTCKFPVFSCLVPNYKNLLALANFVICAIHVRNFPSCASSRLNNLA